MRCSQSAMICLVISAASYLTKRADYLADEERFKAQRAVAAGV
jgi:hypothetical protein